MILVRIGCGAAAFAIVLLSPFSAVASQSIENAPAVSFTLSPALELARVLNSDENIIGDEKSDAQATKFLMELFGSKDDLAETEKQYPGIGQELARATFPIIKRFLRQRLPDLQQRQAEIYSKHFSDSELVTLVTFYKSPTGQKLMRSLAANAEPIAMLEEAKKSDDMTISAESVLADQRRAVPKFLEAMNAEDERVLAEFGRSGLIPRLQKLGPVTQQIMLDWQNEYAPGEEEMIEKVIEDIFAKREAAE